MEAALAALRMIAAALGVGEGALFAPVAAELGAVGRRDQPIASHLVAVGLLRGFLCEEVFNHADLGVQLIDLTDDVLRLGALWLRSFGPGLEPRTRLGLFRTAAAAVFRFGGEKAHESGD